MGKAKPEAKKKRSSKEPATAPPPAGSAPVPIRKVPSLRGKNNLALYAAGAFMNSAPSPSAIPAPPPRWTSPSAALQATAASAPAPAPAALANVESSRLSILGNLLYLTISPELPELAGKLVGMLLELGADEVGEILGSDSLREEAVREALQVLSDAGDERAARALKAPPAKKPMKLTVDIGAANEAQRAAEGGHGSTGLTPALACSGLMRMSPRVCA